MQVDNRLIPTTIARRYATDLTFNGSDLTKNVTISAPITDVRLAKVSLHDNAGDFEEIFCKMTKTSATNVLITTNIALASGTYRLVVTQQESQ